MNIYKTLKQKSPLITAFQGSLSLIATNVATSALPCRPHAKALFVLALLLLALPASAQNSAEVKLTYTGNRTYSLVERTNLLRYVNGKYTGLTSREVRSFISPEKGLSSSMLYEGNFYVLEETKRAGAIATEGIHDSIPSTFTISETGELSMVKDNGYPSFRSFPTFTPENVSTGFQWKGLATRSVDPLNKGIFTKLDMLVLYTFCGKEIYKEKEVYRIKAEWQTNYGGSHIDVDGDINLTKATGSHKADILILTSTCTPLLVLDNTSETFFYKDGTQIQFKGSITLFTEFPPKVEDEKIISSLPSNIPIEKTNAGLRLSLRNLRFKPDSDELLETEYTLLDSIAKALKQVSSSQFLIEGHTARAGDASNELELSQKRARRIAKELSVRGINTSSFICRGWGSEKPIAPNDTEEGRAQNRRVEITILE